MRSRLPDPANTTVAVKLRRAVRGSPFERGRKPVVKVSREHARSRRLDPDTDEETSLLTACGPHLGVVVEAALETGMRKGEFLSLHWHRVEGMKVDEEGTVTWSTRPVFVLPRQKTKTRLYPC